MARPREGGFSLLELLIVVAIIALTAFIAVPGYRNYVYRGQVASAIADVKELEMTIERFRTQNGRLPADLAEIDRTDTLDPWENRYRYLLIEGMPNSIRGQARKDRNLAPINTDFDLYSVGRDGRTSKPVVAAASLDDIVRGRSGGWVGLGADF
jgi:general secretion pathway protein G